MFIIFCMAIILYPLSRLTFSWIFQVKILRAKNVLLRVSQKVLPYLCVLCLSIMWLVNVAYLICLTELQTWMCNNRLAPFYSSSIKITDQPAWVTVAAFERGAHPCGRPCCSVLSYGLLSSTTPLVCQWLCVHSRVSLYRSLPQRTYPDTFIFKTAAWHKSV